MLLALASPCYQLAKHPCAISQESVSLAQQSMLTLLAGRSGQQSLGSSSGLYYASSVITISAESLASMQRRRLHYTLRANTDRRHFIKVFIVYNVLS